MAATARERNECLVDRQLSRWDHWMFVLVIIMCKYSEKNECFKNIQKPWKLYQIGRKGRERGGKGWRQWAALPPSLSPSPPFLPSLSPSPPLYIEYETFIQIVYYVSALLLDYYIIISIDTTVCTQVLPL